MTAFNPLTAILTQNKFEGPNYVDVKQNLDIVLIAEEYKFVLDEVCPEKSGEDSTDDEQKAYQKWVKADEMAQCYSLASMSNVLQYQHQSMESAYGILENLKEMFGVQNRTAKQTAMTALLNTKMVEGSSVRDQVLKMMSILNEPEVLGANIDKDTQVEMILQTLPDSFQQFCLNYNTNKMDLSLVKSLNELQSAETIIKKQAPHVALNFEIGTSSKPRGGQKKKRLKNPLLEVQLIPEEPTTKLVNYDQAVHDKNADKWVAAMKSEMGSMYSNQVWDLVELSDGVKPIECK
ncbi:uncharacterized protein LOC142177095 [Nicotiana tabacum]|uniref:Uncharacterized protein LOC142177095 n=1 Tax=Nicotiana tabacum TaxID=4097 RepID=A0AC58TWW5_TOBAC